MKVYFIRHGATKGNREHRYVGKTDEGLLKEEKERLSEKEMPRAKLVYISPRRRCIETAKLLYPEQVPIVIEDFSECDFGWFEYKNHEELAGNQRYQQFIDTWGASGFPGGETKEEFQKRCIRAFEAVVYSQKESCKEIAFVVHGGTIMAVLEHFGKPHRDYYDWQVKNGQGFGGDIEEEDGGLIITNIRSL